MAVFCLLSFIYVTGRYSAGSSQSPSAIFSETTDGSRPRAYIVVGGEGPNARLVLLTYLELYAPQLPDRRALLTVSLFV